MATTESDFAMNRSRYNLNDEYAAQVWPTILFLALVMLVGSCGNFLVCVVYRCNLKKVNNRFILALAVVDLINCLTSVPGEICDLRFKFTFGESFFCPAMRLFLAFSSIASASILIAISTDRFKKICKPFERQTTLKTSAVAISICFAIAITLALPAAFINGKKTVKVDGVVIGYDCSIADKYVGTTAPQIYNGIFFLLFICACVILIVMYILIWKRLRVQRMYRRSTEPDIELRMRFHRDLSSDDILTSSTDHLDTTVADINIDNPVPSSQGSSQGQSAQTPDTAKHPTVSSLVQSTLPVVRISEGESSSDASASEPAITNQNKRGNVSSTSTPLTHRKVQKASASLPTAPVVDKTTIMMFLVTVVFICSFLPYVGLTTAHAVNKKVFRHLTGPPLAVYNLFLRSHFLNSALNPFIYSFCGQEFRNLLRKLCQRIFSKHR